MPDIGGTQYVVLAGTGLGVFVANLTIAIWKQLRAEARQEQSAAPIAVRADEIKIDIEQVQNTLRGMKQDHEEFRDKLTKLERNQERDHGKLEDLKGDMTDVKDNIRALLNATRRR